MSFNTNKGFSLIEACVVLAMSGLLIGGVVTIYASFIQECTPQAIELDGNIYELGFSMNATMKAFSFHQELTQHLEKSELILCFGGSEKMDPKRHQLPPLSSSFDYASLYKFPELIDNKIVNTSELVKYLNINLFFETNATVSDSTLILMSRKPKDGVVVQIRRKNYIINKDIFHLYSVKLLAIDGGSLISIYRFAINEKEDLYANQKPIKRFFIKENKNREIFNTFAFPDPSFISDIGFDSMKSHSQFVYIFDVF